MRDLIQFGMRIKKRFVGHEIAARSAQMTYYWLLAFFPFLIVIITILSYTSIAEAEFLEYIAQIVPNALIPFIESTINQLIQYRSATLLSFGAIATIWSASAGVNAMIRGVYIAYSATDTRAFWLKKIISMLYTIILAVLIAAMIILLVFGNNIGEYLLTRLISNAIIYKPIWDSFRLIMPIIGLLLGIYMIYKFLPRKHLKNKNVWPGTLFASLGWYSFSYLFSIYVNYFSKYNQMYGSIGGVFVLLIWLYASSMLLLIGAEINALYQDTKKMKRKVI